MSKPLRPLQDVLTAILNVVPDGEHKQPLMERLGLIIRDAPMTAPELAYRDWKRAGIELDHALSGLITLDWAQLIMRIMRGEEDYRKHLPVDHPKHIT